MGIIGRFAILIPPEWVSVYDGHAPSCLEDLIVYILPVEHYEDRESVEKSLIGTKLEGLNVVGSIEYKGETFHDIETDLVRARSAAEQVWKQKMGHFAPIFEEQAGKIVISGKTRDFHTVSY